MPRYEIRFSGRKLGAIGIPVAYTAVREAENPDAAVRALYDEYDHIHMPTVRELNRAERAAVTDWRDWRDVFKSETIRTTLDSPPVRTQRDLDEYRKRTTAHTWHLPDYNVRGDVQRERAPKLPCYLSRFVTVKIFTGTTDDRSWRSVYLDVEYTEQAIEVIARNSVLVDYDTMHSDVIEWPDGRALVVCHNSKIIGGPWVAKIDSSTIPEVVRNYREED